VKTIFFIELFGVAFLVPLVYYWLGIGEASTAQLLWSLFVGMAAVALVAFLVGLAFTRDARRALARTHWLSFVVFAFLLTVAVCLWFEPQMYSLSRWIASWLTNLTRQPIDPYVLARWILKPQAAIIAAFVLVIAPLAARIAEGSPARLTGFTWRYAAVALAYAIVGLVLPIRIFQWIPGVTGPTAEIASFTLRTLAALSLAVAAWLWFAQYVRRHAIPEAAHAAH